MPSSCVHVGRNAAAIVGDGHRSVGIERYGDAVCMSGERLVDGVVDNLIDHVMQAGAVIGVADVHSRALAHRIEAFQNLDRFGAVFGLYGRVCLRRICHHAGSFSPNRPSRAEIQENTVANHRSLNAAL
jgi:hypothetical protein